MNPGEEKRKKSLDTGALSRTIRTTSNEGSVGLGYFQSKEKTTLSAYLPLILTTPSSRQWLTTEGENPSSMR